jgi:uncharacterized protein involved in exopolysaccharide biosynthesis
VRNEYALRVIDPAIPADEHSYVKPKRLTIAAVFAVMAVFVGALLAVILARKRCRSTSAPM